MCGIGLILDKSRSSIQAKLTHLGEGLAHRGPDGAGQTIIETCSGAFLGLVHRRLSIQDLSDNASQPMFDPETGNIIVFNGEIYNFQELRSELLSRGCSFVSGSDTEVLLKAYRFFSVDELLLMLRGMYAFAIWDSKNQRLVLARDPLGIKPIYYSKRGTAVFSCASELRPLIEANLVSERIDSAALQCYLGFGSVQAPNTIYDDVAMLLPGTYLILSARDHTVTSKTFWDWSKTRTMPSEPEEVEALLSQSIKRHLVSDVPVATLLSGGVDSTSIAYMAKAAAGNEMTAFTMHFPDEPDASEIQYASTIASQLDLRHKLVPVTQESFKKDLSSYISSIDQPSDDGINTFLISKAVRHEGFKVALHGVGGDELFGGYASFRQLPSALLMQKIPKPIRSILSKGLKHIDSISSRKLQDLLHSEMSLVDFYLIRRQLFSFKQRLELLGNGGSIRCISKETEEFISRSAENSIDFFAYLSKLELLLYAGNKLLVDGDVMSMANGLELRFPLLDLDLVEGVLSIPERHKRNSDKNYSKPLLVNSVRGLNVDLLNPRKMGFSLPIQQWIRSLVLDERGLIFTVLEQAFGFDSREMTKISDSFGEQLNDYNWIRFWQLYVLGRWLQQGSNRRL
jgi:asparagine synthase (glutamine-hydrolysing)